MIYSTHDEVVNIVKKAGGTLRMKVNTPLIKTKSVSQQIKGRITPMSTPEVVKKPPTPVLVAKRDDPADRETVIDHSPNLPRADWDLSQDEESPGPRRKDTFSYHVPATNSTFNKHSSTLQVKAYPISPQSADSSPQESPDLGYSVQQSKRGVYELKKMATMPSLPPKDYPRLQDYASSNDSSDSDEDENENQSAFALALRKGKEKLGDSGARSKKGFRARANTAPGTPPHKESPLVNRRVANQAENDDQTLSPLQQQILKASRDRSERMMMNQPRLKSVTKEDSSNENLKRNPIARAMSEKIDSIYFDTAEFGGSDDEYSSSPKHSPLIKVRSVGSAFTDVKSSPKLPPPATKPKPSKKQPEDATPPVSHRKEVAPLPFEVKLKSTPKLERKHTTTEDSNAENSHIVDWKANLKPMKKDDSLQSQPSFELPPPLPVVEGEKRMSFVELAPPDDFGTDIPPPVLPSPGDSPLPPPLPDTSPPTKPPSSPTPEIFVFPELKPSSPSHPDLPSPLASPTPGSEPHRSASPITPPVFDEPNKPVEGSAWSPEPESPPPLPSMPPPPLDIEEEGSERLEDTTPDHKLSPSPSSEGRSSSPSPKTKPKPKRNSPGKQEPTPAVKEPTPTVKEPPPAVKKVSSSKLKKDPVPPPTVKKDLPPAVNKVDPVVTIEQEPRPRLKDSSSSPTLTRDPGPLFTPDR